MVLDVQDVRPRFGDERGEPRERARPVHQHHRQAHQPAVLDEPALDDPRDHRDVDVAAREHEDDRPAVETERTVQQRRERGRARALDHGLLDLEQ